MNKAFYTGASGLRAYQHNLDVIGHNITNSSTTGFKTTTPQFRELVRTEMALNKNREVGEDGLVRAGNGVKAQHDDLNFTQGSYQPTDYILDFAIGGEGFFAVMNDDSSIEYTRNGSFDISVEGDSMFLVDMSGRYVLDAAQQRIEIGKKPGTNIPDIDLVKPRLGIYSFINPNGLIRTDGGSFIQSDNSGEPQLAQPGDYTVVQSTLERSNVELSQEMTNMIVGQKAYQFSAKVVTTADEIEQLVNSLRG